MSEHFDVVVVGAGLSGISAAWHLQDRCPGLSWTILEAREAMGGTWDLFRYPGIRSDSDMYTMGYRFRPWRDPEAIADGPAIRAYIEETARETGIDEKIRFRHRMVGARWSSEEARWTVEVEVGAQATPTRFTCSFLYTCTGYYRYDRGYTPDWPELERFQGPVIHPQRWPEGFDHAGRRIVVIGSGATAVTLVPALVEEPGAAERVTMLQRSPTYIVAQPARDRVANLLRRVLPGRGAYALARWKNTLRQMFWFQLSRRWPGLMKRLIRQGALDLLGDDYDVDTHLAPRYDPWDERLCVAPDGDFFEALRGGRAEIVTDRVESFTPTGIRLRSGRELEADVIVTATGLEVQILGGITPVVDGRPVDLSACLTYKGMMYSDVPNLASTFGYTNASWTLKCDLVAEHVCRILNHMRRRGWDRVTPRRNDPSMEEEPALDLTSGYVRRALPDLPSQGSKAPWRLHQNYVKDLLALRYGRVDDPALEFGRRQAGVEAAVRPPDPPSTDPPSRPGSMLRLRVVPALAAFACAVGACAEADPPPAVAGAPLVQPPVAEDLDPRPGVVEVELTAAPERLALVPGTVTDAYAYNGTFPGPTLEVQEGDSVVVRLHNELDQPTTIHWHGLHLPYHADGSPYHPVEPGETFTYAFTIPEGTAGTYWYHPHPDGLTTWQLGKGLLGAFVVRDPDDPLPASLPEKLLILVDNRFEEDGSLSFPEPGSRAAEVDFQNGREGDVYLVNGQVMPRLEIRPGELQRWRILNASGARVFRLGLPGHTLLHVGSDGGLFETPVERDEIVLANTERVEVLVRGTEEPGAEVELLDLPYDRYRPLYRPRDWDEPRPLLTVAYADGPPVEAPEIPARLRPVPPIEVTDSTPVRVMRLTQGRINGKLMDMDRIDARAELGDTEIWELRNLVGMDHPFHLHGFRFQILSVNGEPVPYRSWKDTVNVPKRATVRIAVRYTDYPGKWMFHCHIVDHEDFGMMGVLEVETES